MTIDSNFIAMIEIIAQDDDKKLNEGFEALDKCGKIRALCIIYSDNMRERSIFVFRGSRRVRHCSSDVRMRQKIGPGIYDRPSEYN